MTYIFPVDLIDVIFDLPAPGPLVAVVVVILSQEIVGLDEAVVDQAEAVVVLQRTRTLTFVRWKDHHEVE